MEAWNVFTDIINSVACFVIPIIFAVGVALNRRPRPVMRPMPVRHRRSWGTTILVVAFVAGCVAFAFRGLL